MSKPATCPRWILAAMSLVVTPAAVASAQLVPEFSDVKTGGSSRIEVMSRVPLNGFFRVGGLEIESELSRPYAYVVRMLDQAGFTIIDLSEPADAKILYEWRHPDPELRVGSSHGGENGRYFKARGRYYYVKAVAFGPESPDPNLGAVVFDVTGLPDVSTIKEVGRIQGEGQRRVTHVFPYKHSDGRVLMFTTPQAPHANVYDMEKFLARDPSQGWIGRVPVPGSITQVRAQDGSTRGASYHDTYVAFDPATRQDRLYGAGTGGFHVFDVTTPEEPRHLTSMTAGAGVIASGHTMIATPDQRYAVGNIERQYFPLMFYEVAPGIERQGLIPSPTGAWTADWQDASHVSDVRWPYVFVASFEDGLQVVNMINPKKPKTVAWYYTCECEHQTGWGGVRNPHGTSVFNGAADIDVRNADGLIVMTDYNTGFWAFRMEGFDGWNGEDWDMPNISSEQDWENGPYGARVVPRTS